MQKCFAVINKETPIASYLQHRSIIEVTEEHRSLVEINPAKLDIIDVDKLLYVYYSTDDGDLSFRSDMNMLRSLLASAFFHVSEALFILVDSINPMMEDLIHSALRDSSLTSDKIEILNHTGSLMLSDVGKYISGAAAGQQTTSSYRDVYIREADKEERDRYINIKDGGISAVLPVLTDMSTLYQQRASVEALTAGRVVSSSVSRPNTVKELSRISVESSRVLTSFVVSGEEWTQYYLASRYIAEYFALVGERVLVINLDSAVQAIDFLDSVSYIHISKIKTPSTPEQQVSAIDARFDQIGYVIQFLKNVRGVNNYIFNVAPDNYRETCNLISQLSEKAYANYVTHYNEKAVQKYLGAGYKSDAVFLAFDKLQEDFEIKSYKEQFKSTLVAVFPVDDVDIPEFFTFARGGLKDE